MAKKSPILHTIDMPFGIGSRLLAGLAKVSEEMGEVTKVIGKIIGLGYMGQYWDGTNLQSELEDEIADVEATLEYLKKHNKLDRKKISKRKKFKLKKFARWHKNVRAGRKPNDDGIKKGKKVPTMSPRVKQVKAS